MEDQPEEREPEKEFLRKANIREEVTEVGKHEESSHFQFPPIRTCIFDVDGLLLDSEDIYTSIYNAILTTHSCPLFPWRIKAYAQARGRPGILRILSWSHLPLSVEEFNLETVLLNEKFRDAVPLPGVLTLLKNLSLVKVEPAGGETLYMALATS